MARTPWTTVQEVTPQENLPRGSQFQEIPNGFIEVPNVQRGMVSRAPRDQVPKGSAEDLKNARIRDYWVGRRSGTDLFPDVKPDSDKVLKVITFIRKDNTILLCRVTENSFHVSDGNFWVPYDVLDADGNPATFPPNTRITHAQFFDNLYLADGTNPIWRVQFEANKCQQIDGAPTARFITTFAERIVAGNIGLSVGGVKPSAFAWPVNADPTNWDGLGSGNEDLSDEDIGDHIAHLVGFEDQMVVLRRRSITHVTRQPFADAPFRTAGVIGGLGCDLPYSVARVPNGIIFADRRTREIYLYAPGSRPQPIGSNLNRAILADIDSLDFAEGAYDPFEKEYHLGVVEEGETNITKVWVFSLEKQAWSYDDGPEVSALGVVSVPGGFTIIDDLVDLITDQSPSPSGIIDDYGDEGELSPSLFKGTATGEIIRHRFDADNDWDGTQFEFTFQSPNVGSVTRRRTLKAIIASIEAGAVGDYTIEHSNDNTTWRNSKTVTLGSTGGQRIQLKRQITGDDLWWRIRVTAPQFKINSWAAKILEKGLQHQ